MAKVAPVSLLEVIRLVVMALRRLQTGISKPILVMARAVLALKMGHGLTVAMVRRRITAGIDS